MHFSVYLRNKVKLWLLLLNYNRWFQHINTLALLQTLRQRIGQKCKVGLIYSRNSYMGVVCVSVCVVCHYYYYFVNSAVTMSSKASLHLQTRPMIIIQGYTLFGEAKLLNFLHNFTYFQGAWRRGKTPASLVVYRTTLLLVQCVSVCHGQGHLNEHQVDPDEGKKNTFSTLNSNSRDWFVIWGHELLGRGSFTKKLCQILTELWSYSIQCTTNGLRNVHRVEWTPLW